MAADGLPRDLAQLSLRARCARKESYLPAQRICEGCDRRLVFEDRLNGRSVDQHLVQLPQRSAFEPVTSPIAATLPHDPRRAGGAVLTQRERDVSAERCRDYDPMPLAS